MPTPAQVIAAAIKEHETALSAAVSQLGEQMATEIRQHLAVHSPVPAPKPEPGLRVVETPHGAHLDVPGKVADLLVQFGWMPPVDGE